MASAPDRLEQMLAPAQTRVTGIDFVEVQAGQTVLDVYFLRDPATVLPSLVNNVAADRIRIYSPSGGERMAVARVTQVAWPAPAPGGRRFLRVTVAEPGDFSLYRLAIDDARIDRYYNDREFSFKVHCPTDVDCAATEPACPPDAPAPLAPDYLARDFWSFRGALLDFASQRFPQWEERLEADAGVMLAEAFSALGDDLAYYQDRIARESHLETATQRRSVRRHGRLVDYELHDGLAASAWLEITAAPGAGLAVPAGTAVEARDDAGRVTAFEVGRSIDEMLDGVTFPVVAARNTITAHVWDEDDTCLPCGATEIYVAGNVAALLVLDDTPAGRAPGRWVFLRASPTTAGLPERRLLVRLVEVTDVEPDGTPMRDRVRNLAITRVRWEEEQALPWEMELTTLTLRGNAVPAVAGRMASSDFTIGTVGGSPDPVAVEREGANGSIAYLFTLPDPDALSLCRRGADPRTAVPELRLDEPLGLALREWTWRRSLLGEFGAAAGTAAALPFETHYTLEDGTWMTTARFDRGGAVIEHVDYKRGSGATIRFGDGSFGRMPAPGSRFTARYRVGNGTAFNVAPDSLLWCMHPAVVAVTNPLAATGGAEPETPADARQLAPEAFRAVAYRAVRPEDYAEAAERVEWVQRAGAAFRWTGSWLSAFVTPDPEDSFTLAADRRVELERWLDRFRQAGRETHVPDPVYANLDLEVTARIEASAYRGEVRESVMQALFGSGGTCGGRATDGFFSPDNFSFGSSLERSALEAAIQRVPGVCAVERVRVRRRGWTEWADLAALAFPVAPHEIIRVQNDPRFPERGSLRLVLTGGA